MFSTDTLARLAAAARKGGGIQLSSADMGILIGFANVSAAMDEADLSVATEVLEGATPTGARYISRDGRESAEYSFKPEGERKVTFRFPPADLHAVPKYAPSQEALDVLQAEQAGAQEEDDTEEE